MINRGVRCLKAWGAGMGLLGFFLVVLYPGIEVGDDVWKIPVSLFIAFFPVLLLFDTFISKHLRFSKMKRIMVLWGLLVLGAIEWHILPHSFTQLNFEFSRLEMLIMSFCFLLIAVFIHTILRPKTNLIIRQKNF